jgi:hypothetical protein
VAQRFRGRLAGFEVWLEPDHINEYYWAGPDKPARYAQLVKAVYPRIKAVDPSLPVLAGSLVGRNGNFLRALYAQGIRGFYDGLAVHYYDLVLNSLRFIRQVQTANRDRAPLWLTEVGYASCAGRGRRFERGHVCITERAQSAKLGDLFGALRRPSFVRAVIVYDLQDAPGSTMGMLRADGRTRKPAFATLALAFSGRIGGPRRPTLRLRRRGGGVTASGGGPTGDYFVLKAFRAGSRRAAFQATLRPNKDDRFSLRLPRPLARGRWLVQVQHRWTGLRAQARL